MKSVVQSALGYWRWFVFVILYGTIIYDVWSISLSPKQAGIELVILAIAFVLLTVVVIMSLGHRIVYIIAISTFSLFLSSMARLFLSYENPDRLSAYAIMASALEVDRVGLEKGLTCEQAYFNLIENNTDLMRDTYNNRNNPVLYGYDGVVGYLYSRGVDGIDDGGDSISIHQAGVRQDLIYYNIYIAARRFLSAPLYDDVRVNLNCNHR
jgi:hypothetical protein